MRLPVPAAALLLVACGGGTGGTGATPPTTTTDNAPLGLAAEVVAVLDGDSIAVRVGPDEDEVRLLGINAPEPGECHADESRDFLAAEVGDEVSLVVPAGIGRDQYGRLLAYVYRGSRNLNQWMLASGAALAIATPHPLRPEFLAADDDAWSRGVGMWARGVCRPAGDPGIFFYDLEYDAPGRDDENPNGEYLVLGNSGGSQDIGGWVLRDESSTHRYSLPAGTTLATGELLIVRTGCGPGEPGELHWCATGAVWNNDGDTAMLIDATGAIVARWRYLGG